MGKFDEKEGVWRTIRGRRVFIRKGQSLDEAMKESGKFDDVKSNKEDKVAKSTNKDKVGDNKDTKKETKRKIDYKKNYSKDGSVINQKVNISSEERDNINEAIRKEKEQGYLNYKNYANDRHSAEMYLEELGKDNYTDTNLTTNRFIKNHLGEDRIKTDRNTRYSIDDKIEQFKNKKQSNVGMTKEEKMNATMDRREKIINELDEKTKGLGSYDKYNLAVSKLENEDYKTPTERQYWVGTKERYEKEQNKVNDYFKKQEETALKNKDYSYGYSKETLAKVSDDELTQMLNKNSELYHEYSDKYNKDLEYDQRTTRNRQDTLWDKGMMTKYETQMDWINQEMKNRNMPRYDVYNKENNMVMASSPTKEIAEKYLKDMNETDKSLQKEYNWEKLPEYGIYENKSGEWNEKVETFKNKKQSNVENKQFDAQRNYDETRKDILDYFSEDFGYEGKPIKSFAEQIDYMRNPNESTYDTAKRYVSGGGFLIYNQDMADYLNNKGIKANENNAFDKYTDYMAKNMEKMYNDYKTTSTGAKVQKSAMDNTIEQFKNKKQSNVGVKSTSGTTKLEPIYDSRKSFYGKAEVKQSGDLSELYSYGTLVAQKGTDANGTYYKSMGNYSQTTTRHQKEFFRQSGLTDEEIKQIMKNGNLKKYNK